jgi:Cu/Ag efflux protein CusF
MPIDGIRDAAVLFILLILAGCSRTPPVPEKLYPMQGEVVSLVPQAKDAIIKAGKIGDWMEPMTMEYPIHPEGVYVKLKVGDHIEGTVVVQGYKYYLTGIRIVAAHP